MRGSVKSSRHRLDSVAIALSHNWSQGFGGAGSRMRAECVFARASGRLSNRGSQCRAASEATEAAPEASLGSVSQVVVVGLAGSGLQVSTATRWWAGSGADQSWCASAVMAGFSQGVGVASIEQGHAV